MPKRFSKKKHINKSDHPTHNNSKDSTSSITKSESDKLDGKFPALSSEWQFVDDDYSDPSDLLKLPQYTFEKIDNHPPIKGILRNPKELYKEKSVSFKEGCIPEQKLIKCRKKVTIKTEKLHKFKSVFEKNGIAFDKDYRKTLKNYYKPIYTWSTRLENVYTTGWSFPQQDPRERRRTLEQRPFIPLSQKKVQNYKIKCETSIRSLGIQINELEKKEIYLETLLEEIKLENSINQNHLSLNSSYITALKKLKETQLLKNSCSLEFNDLKIKQKEHIKKNPIYYIYQPK